MALNDAMPQFGEVREMNENVDEPVVMNATTLPKAAMVTEESDAPTIAREDWDNMLNRLGIPIVPMPPARTVDVTSEALNQAIKNHEKRDEEYKEQLKKSMALWGWPRIAASLTEQGWLKRPHAAQVLEQKAIALENEAQKLRALAKEAQGLAKDSALEVFLWREADKISVSR